MSQQSTINNQDMLIRKISKLDFMLESLGRMDKSTGEKVEEWTKKISERKLILIEELYKLLSPLS